MDYSEVGLLSGQAIKVKGAVEEVEKNLSDAARSGHARFAWLVEHGTDEPVGINPDHVATLRSGEATGRDQAR